MPAPILSQPRTACAHCGAECPPHPISAAGQEFCCQGCATVYSLLQEASLEGFYCAAEPGQKPVTRPATAPDSQTWAFLDDPGTVQRLLDYQEGNRAGITLKLPGIHCSSCLWLLERLYRIHPGIVRSEVSFPRKEVRITWDPAQISLRKVAETLALLGYPPEFSPDRLHGTQGEAAGHAAARKATRRKWYQLGVAGFCAGNIMLFSFPEYLGLEPTEGTARLFSWLNLVLALPAVFYSFSDYYTSAWAALKQKRLNIDVPIIMGTLIIFIRSAWDIISGNGAGYFDSLTGLIFFMLIGRVYQAKTYEMLAFDRDYRSYFPLSVRRVKDNGEEESVSLADLKPGDLVRVRNGELIPADGELISGEASLDYSFVTGESDRVPKQAGDALWAGGRQWGGAITLRITREVSQGYLTGLWNHEAFRKQRASGLSRITDTVGKWFTWGVFVVAGAAALYWYFQEPAKVWPVVSTILLIACPCAMALAATFALGNATRILGRNKLYVKGPGVVETLATVDTVVLDKTGTLTRPGAGSLRYSGDTLTLQDLEYLGVLLRESAHPLSIGLAAQLPPSELQAEQVTETAGMGISGWVRDIAVRAGRKAWVENGDESLNHTLTGNGSVIWVQVGARRGVFEMGAAWRTGMGDLLHQLGAQYRLALLTGDTERQKQEVSSLFPTGTDQRYNCSPEEKLAYVQQEQGRGRIVLMLGDGLNDAGALAQSDAGVSLAEDVTAFTPASDAILGGDSLNRLPALLRFCRSTVRVVHGAFALSLMYNAVGLYFAWTGLLSPLVAAILMPISSVSVVLWTLGGTWLAARKNRLHE